MIESTGKVTIGCYPINPEPQKPQLYSSFHIHSYLNKNEIQQFTNKWKANTGQEKVPFIYFEADKSIDIQKHLDDLTKLQVKIVQKEENKQYFGNLKQGSQVKMNIQTFVNLTSGMNQLNNKIEIKYSLYDTQNLLDRLRTEDKPMNVVVTERMKFEYQIKIDSGTLQKLKEIMKEINPQMSQMLSGLSLLQNFDIEINLDSLDCLDSKNLKKVFGRSKYQEPGPQKQNIKKMLQSKRQVKLILFFGQFGIFELHLQAQLLGIIILILDENDQKEQQQVQGIQLGQNTQQQGQDPLESEEKQQGQEAQDKEKL